MKIISKILLFFVFGLALSKANIPPPPLGISYYGEVGCELSDSDLDEADIFWEYDIDQSQWKVERKVEITERVPHVVLSGNRELQGLKISNPRGDVNFIDLKNHKLVLGEAGLVLGTVGALRIYNGMLTSSLGQIKINATFDSKYLTAI